MKRLYIQRYQKGSPVGRTHRLDLQPNWTIYDVLDESRKYLNYEYDSNLQASYQDKVLDLSSSAVVLFNRYSHCQIFNFYHFFKQVVAIDHEVL